MLTGAMRKGPVAPKGYEAMTKTGERSETTDSNGVSRKGMAKRVVSFRVLSLQCARALLQLEATGSCDRDLIADLAAAVTASKIGRP